MTERRMKSDQVRTGWRDALQFVQQGGRIIVEHYNRPVAMLVPYAPQEAAVSSTHTLTIVRGEQPDANGEEFGLAGIKVSDEVYDWFAENGVHVDDPDVWVLVTPADEQPGAVNVIATRDISADTETTYERTTDEGVDRTVVIVEHGPKYVSVYERYYTDGEETGHGLVATGDDMEMQEFLRRNTLDLTNEGYREIRPAVITAAQWADALDAEMRRTGQDAGTLISFGYANGQIVGVTLDPEHPDADDERAVIASDSGWVVGYDAQSGYWSAR